MTSFPVLSWNAFNVISSPNVIAKASGTYVFGIKVYLEGRACIYSATCMDGLA